MINIMTIKKTLILKHLVNKPKAKVVFKDVCGRLPLKLGGVKAVARGEGD